MQTFASEAEARAFALPLVPVRYHPWLRVLAQWRNDKRRESDPDRWVQSFVPYFPVEGLLRQAWDHAAAARATADPTAAVRIRTTGRIEGKHLVFAAEVETPLGVATGHAAAALGEQARQVDRTNPWENAETSAIGRALRHLGYGFGFGLAEDTANGHADSEDPPEEEPDPAPPTPAPAARAPADRPAAAAARTPYTQRDVARLRADVLNEAKRIAREAGITVAAAIDQARVEGDTGGVRFVELGRLAPIDCPRVQATLASLRETTV